MIIEGDVSDTTAALLANLLRQQVRADSIDKALSARVKVILNSTLRFEVGRSEYCRPALANREEISRVLAAANAQAQKSGTVLLLIHVDESGTPSEIEIRQSSGDDMVDGLAVGVGLAMRFRPATWDYVPVPVWASMPVEFAAR